MEPTPNPAALPSPGSSPAPAPAPAAGGSWPAALFAALIQLAELGIGLIETANAWLLQPGGADDAGGPPVGNRLIELFERTARLSRKVMAFEAWLRGGGKADQAAMDRRDEQAGALAAKRKARGTARAAARPAAPALPGAAFAGAAGAGAGAARQTREERLLQAPDAVAGEQAVFEAYFACRPTNEVIRDFGRELSTLARALGRSDQLAQIEALVAQAVAAADAMADEALAAELKAGMTMESYEPLPFVAAHKAARDEARRLDSG
jgi:hypothetical protein